MTRTMTTIPPNTGQANPARSASLGAALRRNADLDAMITADASRFTVLTGDRPTGPLHLGHYFGTLANRLRLQQAGATLFIVIADYQVLTDRDVADRRRDHVAGLVADYLAIGIDAEAATIFTHSAELPALAGSMSHTSQPVPAGVRVTAGKPQQWFVLRPWVFDVTLAGLLLRAAPRPPVPIPVDAWARAYGLARDPGSGRHAISLIGPGPDFSPEYAMTTLASRSSSPPSPTSAARRRRC